MVLIGNKVDLVEKRIISKEAGEKAAKEEFNCSHLESSAKTG